MASLQETVGGQRLVFGDALRPAAEVDGAGNVTTRYVYGGSGITPDYLVRAGVTYRIVADHLGSVRLVVNASTGAVVQRLAYDPYGRVVEDTNPGFQPFGFAGGLYDADAQLVHFGAREYDPETGRWLTRDPLLFDGGDTNLYGYVLADPVNVTDPTGLFGLPSLQSVSDFAAGFGDTVSFGITKEIREVLGSNAAVNFCSGAYRSGGNTGIAYSMVLPGPKGLRGTQRGTQSTHAADDAASHLDDLDDLPPSLVPPHWPSKPSKKGGGTRYWDPEHPDRTIRIMPGNPNDPNPVKRKPYA